MSSVFRRALLVVLSFLTLVLASCGGGQLSFSLAGSSTTTISASATSVDYGTNITLTARVAPSAATGTVTFYDGQTALGSATLSAGIATLTVSSLAAGTHAITASYGGSSTYQASSSSSINVTVVSNASATTTSLSSSATSVALGTNVTLTARVSPTTAGGTVTFYDGASALGSATLNIGVATFNTTSLSAGVRTLTAQYGGSASYLASTSASVSVTVTSSGSNTGVWTSGACGYGSAAHVLRSGTLAESATSYSATSTDQSVVCVTGTTAVLSLTNPTITSSSTSSSIDDSSNYGLNAAVLDYNGGNLTLSGGSITTSGLGGNAVFSYGTGSVTANYTSIKATGANAHGLYAAGGGTVFANYVTASSGGASGAVVATDRGGGTINISGGSYSASGNRSAGIYSAGTVIASNAAFAATNAEAVVIDGSNTVLLTSSNLNASSTTTEHRGVFLYQSTSADATNSTCGTGACFTMNGGGFTYTDTTNTSASATANCAAFAVANQVATFALTDVTVKNSCPTLLLSALNPNWNYKGGTTTFKSWGNTLTGDVIVDGVSSADLYLYASSANPSKLTGALNSANSGKTVTLTLDATSQWVVTGTSYLNTLSNADSTNANITCQTAGCKVYVKGVALTIQ